ncbi:hypothetical protein [Bacillus rubiinfantis]|uniref:hypothetical protein n=1 Tax=Bacillus rubiinfantis TaxID=1499680 RepID=UPI000AE3E151|nr:hypothetical protein [Bacillus rubiinfantis]
MHKLMLIEDDRQLSELTQEYLQRYGYEVQQPKNFSTIIEVFTKIQPAIYRGQ